MGPHLSIQRYSDSDPACLGIALPVLPYSQPWLYMDTYVGTHPWLAGGL